MTNFVKDPQELLDFPYNWAPRLAGDTIQTSTWNAPVGITIEATSFDNTTSTIWVSGGTNGESYQFVNTIETAGGRTHEEPFTLYVLEKSGAIVSPSVAAFLIRFPAFAEVNALTLDAVLQEAIAAVGESWIEADRVPATLYLAAHLLAVQGLGIGSGGGGAAITGAIKSRKVGDVSIEFAGVGVAGSSGVLGIYQTTSYGRRYLELLRMNFPAVAVA